jgi:Asp-tRNA(Asn)/Glu-tRNA(Gln) amidotransferase A subunit family amidase
MCGRYLEHWQDQMDPILVQRIIYTQGATAVDYEYATQRRTALWHIVRRFFERYELLLTLHYSGAPPFAIGEDFPAEIAGRRVSSPLAWFPFTFPFAHDWAAGHFGTRWMDAGRTAGRAPDCRPPLRRCDGA